MSNTRNNTAKIKNRIENGIRAELWGSKPHSKGVLFSKFIKDILFNINVKKIISIGKIIAIIIIIVMYIIILGIYSYLWCKKSLLLQASKKGVGKIPYLTSSKLSVHPAQHHNVITEIMINTANVKGKNCFHVRLINLS